LFTIGLPSRFTLYEVPWNALMVDRDDKPAYLDVT